MLCSICGHTPQEPVVSIKTGHIYEKRLIEEYIKLHKKCPVTGVELTENDIIPLKVANPAVVPRPTTATSIPGMLQLFQNEWDAVMLENYSLQQQVLELRKELTQTLYQHDAACRVIARLTKERDEARKLATMVKTSSNSSEGDIDMIDSSKVIDQISSTAVVLNQNRRKQKNTSVHSEQEVSKYVETASFPLHGTAEPGITSCDLFASKQNQIVTGGADGEVCIFDINSKKILSTLQGHSKRITHVRIHQNQDVIASASADKTVRFWKDSGNGFKEVLLIKDHTDIVTGISFHPTGDYLLSSGLDGNWKFWDIATGSQVFGSKNPSPLTCSSIHVDGALFCTGAKDGKINFWDFKSLDKPCWENSIPKLSCISFSENGYIMATGSEDGTVRLWDLRKMQSFQTITANKNAPVNSICFDKSGKFLSIAASDLSVYYGKNFSPVKLFNSHTQPVTCASFGNNASFIASVSLDRTLKLYGPH